MDVDPARVCELLVGLGDVEVCGVDDEAGEPLRLHVRRRAERPDCVACGGSLWSDGERAVELVDLPAFGRPVLLVWHKRRWRCGASECSAGTVTEQDPEIGPPRERLTTRAGRWVTRQAGRGRPFCETRQQQPSTMSGAESKTTLGHRGRKDDPLWRARKLLVSGSEKTTDNGWTKLTGLLDTARPPRRSPQRLARQPNPARHLQNHRPRTRRRNRDPARRRVLRPVAGSKRPIQLGRTLHRWRTQISNWRKARVTNAATEAAITQPHRTRQTRRVRIHQLQQLPNPSTPLRRETQLALLDTLTPT